MDKKVKNDFRKDYSLDQLEIRFAFEDELESAGMKLPKNEFFRQLYERFEAEGCPKKYGFNMDSKSPKTHGRENTKEKAGE